MVNLNKVSTVEISSHLSDEMIIGHYAHCMYTSNLLPWMEKHTFLVLGITFRKVIGEWGSFSLNKLFFFSNTFTGFSFQGQVPIFGRGGGGKFSSATILILTGDTKWECPEQASNKYYFSRVSIIFLHCCQNDTPAKYSQVSDTSKLKLVD